MRRVPARIANNRQDPGVGLKFPPSGNQGFGDGMGTMIVKTGGDQQGLFNRQIAGRT